jgi:hypothetical protein
MVVNNKPYEGVEKLKCLGPGATNKNSIRENVTCGLNALGACYTSFQRRLPHLLKESRLEHKFT